MRVILPNLNICQKCPRFDRYPGNGVCLCKAKDSEEQKVIGVLKFVDNDENNSATIVYDGDFSLPFDCNFELEQLYTPPQVINNNPQ